MDKMYEFNDGGRMLSGFKNKSGDCVIRSIAIATDRQYLEVLKDIKHFIKSKKIKCNPRKGVPSKICMEYLISIGWKFYPSFSKMGDSQVFIDADDFPSGRVIAKLPFHLVAIIDNVIKDTWDSSVRIPYVEGYYLPH